MQQLYFPQNIPFGKLLLLFCLQILMNSCNLPSSAGNKNSVLALIPLPVSVHHSGPALVTIKPDIIILTDMALLSEARFLQEKLKLIDGLEVGIQTPGIASSPSENSTVITLEISRDNHNFPPEIHDFQVSEAYRLQTSSSLIGFSKPGIRIQGPSNPGVFYGIQTLLQVIATGGRRAADGTLQIPGLDIQDYPRFSWRGSMLDSARHFISVAYIKRHLELMANLKLNVFHWHLSDDQGWRLPVTGLENLTKVGAWRERAEPEGPLGRYGGFYTAAEIKDIVDFASTRHIMIIPEIEMPGHASAAIASYPAIGASGPLSPSLKSPLDEWGIFGNNLDPGKEETFTFVGKVIKELTQLFPGPYIHFGGDELHDISSWEVSPECQARMRQLGLHDTRQLERYFIGRVEQIIRDNDRVPMAWDDVVHSVSQTSTVLQFWTNETNLHEGRDIGFRFVLSPGTYTYLDMNYAAPEVKRWAGFISISRAYSLDPKTWNLADSDVWGVEAPLWTEHIPDEATLDRQIWPRLSAIAEVAWTPDQRRNWEDYAQRLVAFAPLWDAWGVKFYRSPELNWQK